MQTKKLFDQDSYLREFTAVVLSCEPLADAKKRSDGAAFAVMLDQTAFFPEGGGQTADTGTLEQREPADDPELAADGVYKCVNGATVVDVQEVGGEILHYTDAPLPVGAELFGKLNWEERFRKMQNHTGEHIVSGIVHEMFGYDNVGFHLGTDGVTVDFNGVLTDEDLTAVEKRANEAVGQNVPVTVSYPTPEECAALDYRSKLDLTDNIRIVTVEGWDVCACCAPHVSQSGAVGGIKLLSCENWKTGVRIRMLCGMDALEDYAARLENTRRISNLLSVPQLETADAVERLMRTQAAEREETAKLRRALLDSKIAALHETDGNLVIFEDMLDNNGLRNLVNAGVLLAGGICGGFCGNDTDGYRYIIGSRNIPLRAWAKTFNTALDGRGGGSEEMIQGSVKATADAIRSYLGV